MVPVILDLLTFCFKSPEALVGLKRLSVFVCLVQIHKSCAASMGFCRGPEKHRWILLRASTFECRHDSFCGMMRHNAAYNLDMLLEMAVPLRSVLQLMQLVKIDAVQLGYTLFLTNCFGCKVLDCLIGDSACRSMFDRSGSLIHCSGITSHRGGKRLSSGPTEICLGRQLDDACSLQDYKNVN